MNVRRLRAIRDNIRKYPEHFNMKSWFGRPDGGDIPRRPRLRGACGTTACIAGWAVARFTPAIFGVGHWGGHDIPETAKELLGISDVEGSGLFYYESWPEPFRTQYHTAWRASPTPSSRRRLMARCAKIAAQRIDHFIATKGAE